MGYESYLVGPFGSPVRPSLLFLHPSLWAARSCTGAPVLCSCTCLHFPIRLFCLPPSPPCLPFPSPTLRVYVYMCGCVYRGCVCDPQLASTHARTYVRTYLYNQRSVHPRYHMCIFTYRCIPHCTPRSFPRSKSNKLPSSGRPGLTARLSSCWIVSPPSP